MEPDGSRDSSTINHNFYLPNSHPRATIHTDQQYYAVPSEELDLVQATEEDDGDILEGDEDTLIPVGVETSTAWHAMSPARHALVRIAFCILGATVLLPFNALITPSEYYRTLLVGTSQEGTFMSWLIANYNVSCILFGAHATASMQRASVGRRIILSELLILAVLLTTSILVFTSGSASSQASTSIATFPLMMGLTLILAAATSYLQLAIVTLANAYGPSCMGAMLSGQGFVGATISLLQLIAALSASARSKHGTLEEEKGKAHRAAVEYFSANTILMVIGLIVFLFLRKSPLYKDMNTKLMAKRTTIADVLVQERGESTSEERQEYSMMVSVSGINRYIGPDLQRQLAQVLSTQKKVILSCFSISYIFVITLAIFPALTARVQSTGKSIPSIVFVALHFFIFNLGDLMGRSLPSIVPRIFLFQRMKIIALLCLLRTVFIPLVEYCNVTASSDSSHSHLFGDLTFFFIMGTLGLSNGLLATSIFVIGPHQDQLNSSNEQGLAAGLLSWWLSFGLAIGSLSSFVVVPNL